MRRVVFLFFLLFLDNLPGRAAGALKLEAATDREFYPEGVKHKVYVEVKVVADSAANPPGTASGIRNVVLVLDRSGAMAGAPIQALREAVATSLGLLKDEDVLSIVSFGSEVETLIEAKKRGAVENLASTLAQLEPEGGAALYDALNQGAAQLRRNAGTAVSNHMILVTDGRPTKGPREIEDFKRLAELFAREQILLSTIGVGDQFNEDLLATLARLGNGHFRYAAQAQKLPELLQLELAPPGTLVGRDLVLTAQFDYNCDTLESYGWVPAKIEEAKATLHFPYVFSGQSLSCLLGATMDRRLGSYKVAKFHLSWTDIQEGKILETRSQVEIILDADRDSVRNSANPAVIRTMVSSVISQGLQTAIEQLDKGDFKRAQRALKNARSDALDLNYPLEDPEAAKTIAQLEAYLAEVKARGLNQLDRKLLRSGLNNQFQTPASDDAEKH